MRILYLHQYFATPDMAAGTRSYEMGRRLVAAGHDVDIITSDISGSGQRDWSESVHAGVRVHSVSIPYDNRMTYGARILAFAEFAHKAASRAVEIGGDIVFATSTPLTIALPGIYASRRLRVPFVFEVRDLWPEVPIAVGALRGRAAIAAARMLESVAYRSASHIVALSPGMRDGIIKAGYPGERVTVIPNGSDRGLFDVDPSLGREYRSRNPWLRERPLVLYTGSIGLINGVSYLAELASQVAALDEDVCFAVIGTGREEELVRGTAKRLGVLDRSFFTLPPVPKHELPALLSASDIATSTVIDVPATWNNSANKVFDAFAAGRPVAINHEGWLAELLRESGAGLVLPPRDLPAAAASLVRAIRDQDWATRARAASRRLARERFDRNQLATQLEQVLDSVATSG